MRQLRDSRNAFQCCRRMMSLRIDRSAVSAFCLWKNSSKGDLRYKQPSACPAFHTSFAKCLPTNHQLFSLVSRIVNGEKRMEIAVQVYFIDKVFYDRMEMFPPRLLFACTAAIFVSTDDDLITMCASV